MEFSAKSVLFTDVRNSTKLLEISGVKPFFEELNRRLTQQCDIIHQYSGSVIKFTGDGLLASFGGADRLTKATQCAVTIQELSHHATIPSFPMLFGQGVCDGLVVVGCFGEGTDAHQDLFGWPVYVAARLCGHAPGGSILLTKKDFDRMHPLGIQAVNVGLLELKGFADPVDCMQINGHAAPPCLDKDRGSPGGR